MTRPEANYPSFQDIANHSLQGVFPSCAAEFNDGFAPFPRKMPAELEQQVWIDGRRSLPKGHIAIVGDFEPLATDINSSDLPPANDLT